MNSAPPRILVINVSRIGDTLLATPAIRSIAAAFPGARITCLGHPKRVEVLAHIPFIQRICAITKTRAPWMGRFGGKRYDWAFVYGFDRPLVEYALRVARKVVAFAQGDPKLADRLYKAGTTPPPHSLHAAHSQLVLPAPFALHPTASHLSYTIREQAQSYAPQSLQRQHPDHSPP